MAQSRLQINGLRYRLYVLKKRLGTKYYYSFFSILAIIILTAIIFPLTLLANKEESFADAYLDQEKVVEIRFLNTQTNAALGTDANGKAITYNGDEANLIKTKDDKYVLIDTGILNEREGFGAKKIIYDALYDWQNGGENGKVTIDYLIISHMHSDHFGNAVNIINDANFQVNNLIIKFGNAQYSKYDEIVNAAKAKDMNIYSNAPTNRNQMNNYAKYTTLNTEGYSIQVGDYLKLFFYNTEKVYSECVKGYHLDWYLYLEENGKSNIKNITKNEKNKYLQYNNINSTYPNNINYSFTDTLINAEENGFNKYFYASFIKGSNGEYELASSCEENANSYGILAEIKFGPNADDNKYAYFTNDLDNSGYDIKPTTTNVEYYDKNSNLQTKSVKVYGQGRDVLYEKPDLNLVKNGTIQTKNFAYSESKVSLEIADKLGDDLSKLVIYQQSHHGINNAPDALERLNINRAEVYAIANRRNDFNHGYTRYSFSFQRSKQYLEETTQMFTGLSDNGVHCVIDSTGNYKCSYKELVVNKLSYDMNGGTGSIAPQTCLSNGACNLRISDIQPTRNNYEFLGWSKRDNSSTAVYKKSSRSIEVNGDVTLYAVWSPIHTLSYDLNGAAGSIASQTCFPGKTTDSCSIRISSVRPTRNGYYLLGWSETALDTIENNSCSYSDWPEFDHNIYNSSFNIGYTPCHLSDIYREKYTIYGAPGTISLTENKTLHAVWIKRVHVNASVEGGGTGTVFPAYDEVSSGNTTTITFRPGLNEEIESVKVNGVEIEETELIDNTQTDWTPYYEFHKHTLIEKTLLLNVGDTDINVVVKFKGTDGQPLDNPRPSITFYNSRIAASHGYGTKRQCRSWEHQHQDESTSCEIQVPSDIPTREGYVFLGYGTFEDENTVVYEPGKKYLITDVTAALAIWVPIRQLNFDLNGGDGTIETQTCDSNVINESCTITINSSRPTKEGYEFFGWATNAETQIPEYLPGDEFVFSEGVEDITLYAVWAKGEIEWHQGQNYKKESEIDPILEIEYPMSNFVSLKIDGTTINPNNYTIYYGSTIIAINHEYVDILNSGDHTLSVSYDNGATVQTNLTITTPYEIIYDNEDYDDSYDYNHGIDENEDYNNDEKNEDNNNDNDDNNGNTNKNKGNTSISGPEKDDEIDSDKDIQVPNTGGNTNSKNENLFTQCIFLTLIVTLMFGGYKIIKRSHRKHKFSIK